jgi:hypothetical protein
MESIARVILLLVFVAVLLALVGGGPHKEGGWPGVKALINGLWVLLRTVRHVVPLKGGGRGGLVETILGERA